MYHINCGKESGRDSDVAKAEYPDNVLFWCPGENGRYCATDTHFFIFIGGSTMRNKKGFTLVELVIVIAVIAILAGVMIGTFASVVKKAQKSAEQQEMAAAKQEQVANDVIEKLNNGSWLGWTDFEEKLAKALADVNPNTPALTEASVKAAVAAALNEYAAAHPGSETPNTGLTEQQVKYIIENALSGQLTAEQVKAIVNNAVSSTSTLTKSQVQAIVEAAVGKTVTASQVKEAVDAIIKANKVGTSTLTVEDVEKTVNNVLNTKNYSVLTEKEVEKVVSELLKNYSVSSKEVSNADDIKKAITEAPAGATIVVKLTTDELTVDATNALKITKNMVIDLNGKNVVTKGVDAIEVASGVTVTFSGDGEVKGDIRPLAVGKGGNVVINGGTFTGGKLLNGAEGSIKAGNYGAIKNGGMMTINGGTFNVNSGAQYIVYGFDDSTTVINGGTFTAGTVVATNGKDSPHATVIINGGEFNGTEADKALVFIPAGTFSVYGGTFNAKTTALCVCGGTTNLYGGTFASTVKGTTLDDWDGTGPRVSDATILVNVYRHAEVNWTAKVAGIGYDFGSMFVSKDVVINSVAGNNDIQVYEGLTKDKIATTLPSSVTVETATAE